MLGLRANVVDIPYDMISSVRIDKGIFSSNVIFKAPGLNESEDEFQQMKQDLIKKKI